MGSGIWYAQSVLRRCEWGIVLKNPVMSNIRIEALCLWFQAISMSCTVHNRVSSADLPGIPPNCEDGNRLNFAVMYASLQVCTHSNTFPRTSSNWMSLYDLGNK